jgi:hypothetical protein
MARLRHSQSRPPLHGEVYFDRNQAWAIEIDAHDGMLYIRESDPDYREVHNVCKSPLLSLASSSTAALARAKQPGCRAAPLDPTGPDTSPSRSKVKVGVGRLCFLSVQCGSHPFGAAPSRTRA